MTDTEVNKTGNTPVACENDVKTVRKGKNKHVFMINSNNMLAKGHEASHKHVKHTVSSRVIMPDSMTKKTLTETEKGVINECQGQNSLQNSAMDKYALERQNSNKSTRIQEAKAAPGNEQCIEQNRPLFGFIPIYGLKSWVYDKSNNSICTDIIELHKKLRSDGRSNYLGLQIPLKSKLNYDTWAAYLNTYGSFLS